MPDAIRPGPPPPPYDRLPDTGSEDSYLAALHRIDRRLKRLEETEQRRAGAAKTLTTLWAVFGGLITAGAIGLSGWVWTIQGQTNANTAAHIRNAERHEEHRRLGGPLGHPDIGRSAVAEGRITALEGAVSEIRAGMSEHRELLTEILDRLPRRR